MKPEQLCEALESVASQLGIKVRYENLAASGPTGGGGLCKVKGEWFIIIDKKTAGSERASILAEAVATRDTDALTMPNSVRDLLQHRRDAARKAMS